jgi:hypothetical protein
MARFDRVQIPAGIRNDCLPVFVGAGTPPVTWRSKYVVEQWRHDRALNRLIRLVIDHLHLCLTDTTGKRAERDCRAKDAMWRVNDHDEHCSGVRVELRKLIRADCHSEWYYRKNLA